VPAGAPAGLKVFGIGLNKTGTTSLGVWLSKAGFSLVEEHSAYMVRLALQRSEDLFALVHKHSGFEDFPWPLVYKECFERFPGALQLQLRRRQQPQRRQQQQQQHQQQLGGGGSSSSNSSSSTSRLCQHASLVIVSSSLQLQRRQQSQRRQQQPQQQQQQQRRQQQQQQQSVVSTCLPRHCLVLMVILVLRVP
jgi:hypothetical protein